MNRMMDLANYVVQRAADNGTPITNLHLQKILYFLFRNSIQANENVELLKEIYDENFLVWRYGPVVESVFEEYSQYGSMEIDEPAYEPRGDYNMLNKYIDNSIDTDVFTLINESHRHKHWQENRDKIRVGRSSIPYEFEDIEK